MSWFAPPPPPPSRLEWAFAAFLGILLAAAFFWIAHLFNRVDDTRDSEDVEEELEEELEDTDVGASQGSAANKRRRAKSPARASRAAGTTPSKAGGPPRNVASNRKVEALEEAMRNGWDDVEAFYTNGAYEIDDIPPTTKVIDLIYDSETYKHKPVFAWDLFFFCMFLGLLQMLPWFINIHGAIYLSLESRVSVLENPFHDRARTTLFWIMYIHRQITKTNAKWNEKRRMRDYVRYLSLEDVPIDATVSMFKSDPRFLYASVEP